VQVRGKNLDEVIFPHANVGTAMRIAQNLQSAKPSEKTLAFADFTCYYFLFDS